MVFIEPWMSSFRRVALMWGREIKQLGYSPSTYVIGSLFMGLCGLFFTLILHFTGTGNLTYLYRNVGLVLVFIVPAVTMGSFVVERREGTDALYLTAPLSAAEVALAKYLASTSLAVFLVLTTLQYPLWISFFAPVDWGRVAAGTSGSLLLAAFLTALGSWAAALASGQALACIIAITIGIILWCAGSIASLLPGIGEGSLRSLSLFERTAPFTAGIVDSGDALFFVVGAGLVLVLMVHSMRRFRVAWRAPSTWGRVSDTLVVVAVIVSLCLVQALFDRHAVRRDWTAEGAFTLAEPTRTTLSRVVGRVDVTVFIRGNDPRRTDAEALLREFERHSSALHVRFVDPEISPADARRHGMTSARPAAVLSRDDRVVLTRGVEETHLLSGLRRILRTSEGRVVILQGHGETDMLAVSPEGGRMFAEALVTAGLTVDPLMLLHGEPQIPSDVTAVVIMGPQSDLLPTEKEALMAYLESGGGIVLGLDGPPGPGWAQLLESWGISLAQAVVVDPVSCVRTPFDPICRSFRPHPVTRPLHAVVFHDLHPLTWESRANMRHVPLIQTSSSAWGQVDRDSPLVFDANRDLSPPLTAALAAERVLEPTDPGTERTGRMVVIGDAQWATNDSLPNLDNAELALGAVEWAAGYAEGTVLLPRRFLIRRVHTTPAQFRVIAFICIVGMPLAALVGAFFVMRWRDR